MPPIQALILGIIQGITEFLPISSSGHLVLIPTLFGWDVQPTSFDITLHAATLLAIIVYFRKDLINLVKTIHERDTKKLLLNIIITSIPTGLVGYFCDDFINATFKGPAVIVIMLISVGLIMILIDKTPKKNSKSLSSLTYQNALIIGLLQTLSLIRGTSRSGITIIGGIFTNLPRTEAARYAFLAGIPLMGAVSLKQIIEFQSTELEIEIVQNLIIGFVSALISGIVAMKLLLHFLTKRGLVIFGIYRIILGIIILAILHIL